MHTVGDQKPRRGAFLRVATLAILLLASLMLLAPAADHRDGPIFVNTAMNGRRDLNDIYIFTSPLDPNSVVIAVTISPFPGVLTPVTFDTSLYFDINVHNTFNADGTVGDPQ